MAILRLKKLVNFGKGNYKKQLVNLSKGNYSKPLVGLKKAKFEETAGQSQVRYMHAVDKNQLVSDNLAACMLYTSISWSVTT